MLPRLISLRRTVRPLSSSLSSLPPHMSRGVISRAAPFPLESLSTAYPSHLYCKAASPPPPPYGSSYSSVFGGRVTNGVWGRVIRISSRPIGRVFAERRYRRLRQQPPENVEKELELSVQICIEENLPDNPEISVGLSFFLIICILALWQHLCVLSVDVLGEHGGSLNLEVFSCWERMRDFLMWQQVRSFCASL